MNSPCNVASYYINQYRYGFLAKPFSLEKFLEAMLSLPVIKDETPAHVDERKGTLSSTIVGSKIDD